MTLKDELDAVVKSAVSDMGEIRAQLTALEHAMPGVCGRTGNIRQIMMTLTTRLTGIKVIAAKEVMCGNEEPATKQERLEDLELFAGVMAPMPLPEITPKDLQCVMRHSSQARGQAALLNSLHRAGDHSLDTEEGAL